MKSQKKLIRLLHSIWTLAGAIIIYFIFDAADANGTFSQEFITKTVRLYALSAPVLAGITAWLRKKD